MKVFLLLPARRFFRLDMLGKSKELKGNLLRVSVFGVLK